MPEMLKSHTMGMEAYEEQMGSCSGQKEQRITRCVLN
jgi:hypothetical protein